MSNLNEAFKQFLAAWNAVDTLRDEGFEEEQPVTAGKDFEEITSQSFAIENTGPVTLAVKFNKMGGKILLLRPHSVFRKFMNRFWVKTAPEGDQLDVDGAYRTFSSACPPELSSQCCGEAGGGTPLARNICVKSLTVSANVSGPDQPVTGPWETRIIANPDNTGEIFVACGDNCFTTGDYVILKPGASVGYFIDNWKRLRFSASNLANNDKVIVTSECNVDCQCPGS